MELLAEQARLAHHPIDMGDPGSHHPRLTCRGIGPLRVEHHLAQLHRPEALPPGLPPRGGPCQGCPLRPRLVVPLLRCMFDYNSYRISSPELQDLFLIELVTLLFEALFSFLIPNSQHTLRR